MVLTLKGGDYFLKQFDINLSFLLFASGIECSIKYIP